MAAPATIGPVRDRRVTTRRRFRPALAGDRLQPRFRGGSTALAPALGGAVRARALPGGRSLAGSECSNQFSNWRALALFGSLQHSKLVSWQVLLDSLPYHRAKLVGVDCVELYRYITEVLGAAVTRFGGPGWLVPCADLLGCNRNALEIDFSPRRQIAQRFLDLLPSIDPGGVVITEVVDVRRHL